MTPPRAGAPSVMGSAVNRAFACPEPRDHKEAKVSDMGTSALWYAKHGIPVFPLHYPVDGGCSCCQPDCGNFTGKHPLTQHGFKDATTDEGQVTRWWRQWPDANIGIPTGAASGFDVLDTDPRHGGPATGEEIIRRFGPIPETAEVTTGQYDEGIARHLYFQHGGTPLPKSIASGVDLKGDGGYVVAPPSLHMSGKRYQVDGLEGARALFNIAPAPEWLKKAIAAASNGANGRAKAEPVTAAEKWPAGERNNRLTSIAGTMRRRGLSREAIQAALLEENRLRCDPPLPEAEVRAIAASVARYEPGQAHVEVAVEETISSNSSNSSQEWPAPLQQEAYYGVVGDLVREIEPHSEADPAAILIQLLAASGSIIGRSAHWLVEADRHFMNIFAVLVGRTAHGRKGTSLGHIFSLLREVDPDWCSKSVTTGLSSGEGLIWSVRDEIHEHSPLERKAAS